MSSDARTAHQLDTQHFDPGQQQIGAVYAQALLGAAESAGTTDAVLEELDSFVSEVLDRYPDFEAVLSSRMVSHEDKVAILDRTVKPQASELFLNFLKVLSERGRLNALRPIRRAARELHDQMRGRVRVNVSTATELGDEAASKIAEKLRGLLGQEPTLQRRTDPNLIGGVVLRIGDTLYDGSIAARLEQLRQQMIQRSVHEIQMGRDRFSDSEAAGS